MNRIPRQLVGRLAALLTAMGAIASMIAGVLAHGAPSIEALRNPALSLVVAVVLWLLPWEKFGHLGTLGFMWLSLAALFFGDLYQLEDAHPEEVPVFLLTLFSWNGLAHDRWSSLKFAPLALAVLVLPDVMKGSTEVSAFTVGLTLPMCLFVGELVAWVTSQLVTAQEERKLADLKADFLTAASHELRTPLTSVMGYARLLQMRKDDLSPENVTEFSERIFENSSKLEAIVSRLVDAGSQTMTKEQLHGVGLLAAHYQEGGAAEVQPESVTKQGHDGPVSD